jgi:RNA polymerase sigma-70 factor (ECF subfamily)
VQALTPVIRRRVAAQMRRRVRARRSFEQELDDVVQAVLLAVFAEKGGALSAWDPARGLGLEAFVSLVASREVDSILRSRRRNPWTETPVLTETLDAMQGSQKGPETLTGSRRMLLTVAARLRERTSPLGFVVFEMLFLQDRSPEDVAATLGLGVAAVRARKSRLSRVAREIVAELSRERAVQDPRRLRGGAPSP